MKKIKTIFEQLFTWKDSSPSKRNPHEVKLNPFTLAFPKSMEIPFLERYFKDSIAQSTLAMIVGGFFYSSFFFLDYFLAPEHFVEFIKIRFGVTWFMVLTSILIINKIKNKSLAQPIIALTVVSVASTIVYFIVIAQEQLSEYYYVGIIVVYFWSYSFLKLRFIWATISGFLILLFYELSAILIIEIDFELLVVSSSFLIGANFVGMLISYSLEYYSRKDYFQRELLKRSFEANETLSSEIGKSNILVNLASEKLSLQNLVLESAANSILILDVEGNIQWANPAFTLLTGYSQEEAIGKNPRILKSGKHNEAFYKNIWDTVLGGSVWSGEIINKKKSGELYYEEMTITPVRENDSEKITHFISIKQDASPRKALEKELFESEKKFRTIFENATIGIYRSSLNGKVLMANEALIKMLGFDSFDDFKNIDLNSTGYVNSNQRSVFAKHVVDNGSVIGFESEWRKKDGSIIFIRENARLDYDKDGRVVFEGAVEDITSSKLANIELNSSKERLQTVFDSLYDAVFIHDLNGKIINVNSKVLDLFNVSMDEVLSLSMQDLSVLHDSMETLKESWKNVINKSKTYKFEWKNKRPTDNYSFDTEVFLSKITLGSENYILANVRDITERKQVAESLTIAKERAEQSDKLKTEFLAGMSHEIRTPINTVLNFISLLKSDLGENTTDDIRSYFEMIDNGSRRLIRTIDSIINMSQLQAGAFDLKTKQISVVEEILNPLIKEFNQVALRKNLKLSIVVNTAASNVLADQYTLTQLFINLIDNALKYTKEGSVNVIADSDESFIIIRIVDTGIGVSDEFRKTMFEPFVQEEMGYTRSFEGNGLGLALVKKYCALNNAEISVESQKAVGSTFTIKLNRVD